MQKESIKEFARKTILTECEAIEQLSTYINDEFAIIVQKIFESKGRVVISGIGKSAIIANKIVATLNSTGTPSIFLHAADAIHGDLGSVQAEDIVICISKSGNTPEIKVLIPLIKNMGNCVIGMVGNLDSFLAKHSNYILNTTVSAEACPNNLAPTSSTTAQLVMGDALAMTLLKMRGFTSADFAKFHPGGALGKKLYTTVGDIMSKDNPPAVSLTDHLDKIIIEISTKRLGATAVVENGEIRGVITDGDLRRMLMKVRELLRVTAADIMSVNPKCIDADELAINAFNIMESNKITQLLVTSQGKYKGIIHIHDILREGVI